jgi:hypothetical protein
MSRNQRTGERERDQECGHYVMLKNHGTTAPAAATVL